MNTVTLPVELANRILNYLSRQPYADVAVMIADIQRAAAVVAPPQMPDAVRKAGKNGQAAAEEA